VGDVAAEPEPVNGVTTTPVTFPVIAAFCFFPFVPRAARVARFFSRAAIFCCKVRGAGC